MNAPQPYVILGHGSENITTEFDARAKLPEGYTLVTLAECGAVTNTITIGKFLDAFSDPANADLFSNPANPMNKAAIQGIVGNKIHVYRSGDAYPDLNVQCLLDWPGEVSMGELVMIKSGVHPFPLDKDVFEKPYMRSYTLSPKYQPSFGFRGLLPATIPENLENKRLQSMSTILANQYEGSLFPTQSQVSDILTRITRDYREVNKDGNEKLEKYFNFNTFKKRILFPLSKILESGKPGVYFYVICRAPGGLDLHNYVETWVYPRTEKGKQFIAERFDHSVSNVIPHLPTIFRKADKLAKVEQKRINAGEGTSWNSERLLAAPQKFRDIYGRTMRTRALSNAQQEALNAAMGAAAGAGGAAAGAGGAAAGAGGGVAPSFEGGRRHRKRRSLTRRHRKHKTKKRK